MHACVAMWGGSPRPARVSSHLPLLSLSLSLSYPQDMLTPRDSPFLVHNNWNGGERDQERALSSSPGLAADQAAFSGAWVRVLAHVPTESSGLAPALSSVSRSTPSLLLHPPSLLLRPPFWSGAALSAPRRRLAPTHACSMHAGFVHEDDRVALNALHIKTNWTAGEHP